MSELGGPIIREPAEGYWLAYHEDWSGFRVFRDEVPALRYAIANCMSVVFVQYGQDPREVVGA